MPKSNQYPPPRGMIGPRVSYLSKLLRKEFNKALAEQGLFSGQQDIVFSITENEGITVSALAKMLNASPASISVSLKRMEKSGFIIKKPDKEDSRLIRLYPTQKAKNAPENVKKHMDSLENTLSKGMSKEEALSFSDLLQKAIDNMKERSNA